MNWKPMKEFNFDGAKFETIVVCYRLDGNPFIDTKKIAELTGVPYKGDIQFDLCIVEGNDLLGIDDCYVLRGGQWINQDYPTIVLSHFQILEAPDVLSG